MNIITHRAFFGDKEHDFTLTDNMVAELERMTETGIGTLFSRLVANQFHLRDLTEIIRLGLVGAGTNPKEAADLVKTYATDRPLDEIFPLAIDILDARWNGKSKTETLEEIDQNAEADFDILAALIDAGATQ